MSVLQVNDLHASYSSSGSEILKGISFDVAENDFVAIIGPSGAGKSTVSRLLYRFYNVEMGSISIDGQDISQVTQASLRACIGIVPQEVNFDPFFSPKKLLELQAGLYGIKKEDRITKTILKLVSLEKQANSYARSLSGGMKRRLLIAKAMVHRPPILVLDEPTAGVDVQLRQNLWNNVKTLNKQ